jgi:hypothetical protein
MRKRAPLLAMMLFPLMALGVVRADPLDRPILFPNPVYTVPDIVETAATGDVNGDGLPDFAFLPSAPPPSTETIAVLLGRGFGRFEMGPPIASGTATLEIELADLNHDGLADMIELSGGGFKVRFSLGETFGVSQIVSAGTEAASFEAVDFDGDGSVDLVVPAVGGLKVAANHGDGTFSALAFVPVSGPFMTFFRFADFNNDGRLDLISSVGTVSLRNPSGGFGSPISLGVSETIGDILTADLDRDGNLDAIVTGTSAHHVLLGDGDGSFNEAAPLPYVPVSRVQVLDFDHDRKTDVAMTDGRIFPGHGDGTFGPALPVRGRPGRGFLVSDVDRDGWQDFVSWSSRYVTVLLNNRNTLGRSILGLPPTGPLFLRDLDEDGLDDLMTAGDAITVFLRRAGGGFEEPLRFAGAPLDGNGHRATLLDADDDGHVDVAIAGDSLTSVALGGGDGAFEAPVTYAGGENHDGIAGLDLAQEGDDDLAVSCWESVCLRTATGDGTYSPYWRVPVSGGLHGLRANDLDHDGRKDLLGISFNPSLAAKTYLTTLLQQPDGTFVIGDAHSIPYSLQGRMHLADLNGDGWTDVIYPIWSTGLGVFYGTPGGHLAAPVYVSGSTNGTPAVADFDLDGNLDIALFNSGDIQILLGDGDGFPANRQQAFFVPDRSIANDDPSMVVGDFNDDGLPDFAFSSGMGAVTLFHARGEPAPPTMHVPIADAGSDQTVECPGPAGAMVLLDGAGSTDADSLPGTDDGIARLEWFTAYGTAQQALVASGPHPSLVLQEGTHVFTLRVTDWTDLSTIDETTVTVQGTQCNRAPVSVAGADRAVECQSPAGATVLLDGSASTDANSTPGTNDDIATFEWFTGYGTAQQALVGTGQQLSVPLPFGTSVFTLRATDQWGMSATDAVQVTVQDTTPPLVTASLDRTMLWPPNHRMLQVQATVGAFDLCGSVTLSLAGVVSSEPDDVPGPGDGQTPGDIVNVSSGPVPVSFLLRAERDSGGPGRTYTLSYQALDSHGNVGDRPLTVDVPHDIDGITEPLILRMEESMSGTIVRWDPVPGARWYNVIVGDLAALRALPAADDSSSFCVALGLSGLDTTGSEVNVDPDIGQAFFFLVEYDDGQEFEVDRPSGYGTESAPYDRTPAAPSSACP